MSNERSLLRVTHGLLLMALLVAGGCGNAGQLRYDSAKEAHQKGIENFEEGDYQRATEYFQAVFDYGRAHEWAADAQFYLGRAYYQDEKYVLAASEFARFLQLYRQDERAPRAEYMRAMSYYKQSPPYQLDQTKTKQAIDYFQLFLDRYPNHELASQAQSKIEELRKKLARKKFAAAELYERQERYEAAAKTYEDVFDKYPDTVWADDALLGAIRSYIAYSDLSVESKQAERLQPALDLYDQLVQLYPDSPLLKEAEALYEKAQRRMETFAANES